MHLTDYINIVRNRLESQAHMDVADRQEKKLRNRFIFFGLMANEWVGILRSVVKEYGYPDDLEDYALAAYEYDQREMHYSGLWMLERRIEHLPADYIRLMESLITQHSWWDTTDWLAKLIGRHFQRYPDLKNPYIQAWSSQENIWLIRLCLLHQLAYKEKTDEELLYHLINQWKTHPSPFVQKAISTALKKYRKINSLSARPFVQARALDLRMEGQ